MGDGPETPPTGFTMGGVWEVIGGTGQFAGAVGQGWLGGLGQVPGDATIDLSGAVTLEAPGEPE